MVGREKEQDGIAVALETAASGTKRGTILLGDPGIGKSALLRHARAAALDRGFLAGATRAPEVGGPHSPLPHLLHDLRGSCRRRGIPVPTSLARAQEVMRGERPNVEPSSLLPLLAEALETLGAHEPVGLFVDDYHRAPAEGTGLLIAALHAVDGPFLLAATSRRPERDATTPLPAPAADLWIDHVEVEGLPAGALGELAADVLGDPVLPSLALALAELTMGNPLYVEELLRSWAETRAVVLVGGYWGLANGAAGEPPPRSLAEMVADRLERLGPAAVHLARTLALIGRDARFDELRDATGAARAELVELLIRLRDGGVCMEEPGPPVRYRLAHPLYEATLLSGVSATERAALHQSVLEAFRDRRGVRAVAAAELAHHGLEALEPPEDLPQLIAAAASEAADAGSLGEAARWWERLAEAGAQDAAVLTPALEGQAEASVGFDAPAAVGLYTRALGLTEVERDRCRLLIGRATAHRRAGAPADSSLDLERALASADSEQAFDIRRAIAINEAALGRLAEARRRLDELRQVEHDPVRRTRSLGTLAGVLYATGDLDGALALAERALADEHGCSLQLRGNVAWLKLALGAWDESLLMAEGVMQECERAGDRWHLVGPLAAAARIHAWRGRCALAIDMADRAVKVAGRLGNAADTIDALEALTVALLEAGHPPDAASTAARVAPLFEDGAEYRADYPLSFAVCAEALLEAGDPVGAREMLARARGQQSGVGWLVAADRVEAQIHLSLRDPAGALRFAEGWLGSPSRFPYEQARIHEVAAAARAALGDRPGAVAEGEAALELYRELQAMPRVARMGQWVDKRRPRSPGRPRSDLPGGLTPREMEVLRLVLHGLTNQQIAEVLVISTATARKHVENLMRKGRATRRTQLVEFARGLGVRPELATRKDSPGSKGFPTHGRARRRDPGR